MPLNAENEVHVKISGQQWIQKAEHRYLSGALDEAVELGLLAIGQDPQGETGYRMLASILVRAGHFKDALDVLNQFPSENKTSALTVLRGMALLGMGRHREVTPLCSALLADPRFVADSWYLKAQIAFGRKELAHARTCFQRALKENPAHAHAHMGLGEICFSEESLTDALDHMEKGLALDATWPEFSARYHDVIAAHKLYVRARPIFAAAMDRHPINQPVHFLYIDILLQQDQTAAAMSETEKAMAAYGISDGLLGAALSIREKLGPDRAHVADGRRHSLSVCLLVKNEEAHLARALASIKPVADQIVVADTGSTDRSRQIATAFGAAVFDFKWCEDFAAARNFLLSKAGGEWIFSLDADEVVSNQDHALLLQLIRQDRRRPCAYAVETRNYIQQVNVLGWQANKGAYPIEEAGLGWFASTKVRLFPNHANIRFSYPVHELVEPSLAACGVFVNTCQLAVHHYGKLDLQNAEAKGRRYLNIGMRKLDQLNNRPQPLRELAIQAQSLECFAEAVSLWKQVVEMTPDAAEAFVSLAAGLSRLGRHGQALEASTRAVQLAPALKEAHFNQAMAAMHLGQLEDARAILAPVLVDHSDYLSAQFLMFAASAMLGDLPRSKHLLRLLAGSELGPALAVSCTTLAESLQAAGQSPLGKRFLSAASGLGVLNEPQLSSRNRSLLRKEAHA